MSVIRLSPEERIEKTLLLLEEAESIAGDVELSYNENNGEEMVKIIGLLSSHLGRLPELKSRSLEYLTLRTAEATEIHRQNKTQATYMKPLVAGEVATEQRVVDFIEQLSNSLRMKIDALRSALSYLKAEMQNLGSGGSKPQGNNQHNDDYYERQSY
jgi:uncharacterized FlaG/YvyC family protein